MTNESEPLITRAIGGFHSFGRYDIDHIALGTRERAEFAIAYFKVLVLCDAGLAEAAHAVTLEVHCGRAPPVVALGLTHVEVCSRVVFEREEARCAVRVATGRLHCLKITFNRPFSRLKVIS